MAVALPVESVCQCGGIFPECSSFLSLSSIPKQLKEYASCERKGECSAGGTEGPAVLDSSCSGTTADFPLGSPARTGAGRILCRGGGDEDKSLWPVGE